LIVDPSGKFVYLESGATPSVLGSLYPNSVDTTTGVLTPLSPAAVTTGGYSPGAITFDRTGKFLYVLNMGDSSIAAFAFDPTTGALTSLPGSPFATGLANGPSSVLIGQLP